MGEPNVSVFNEKIFNGEVFKGYVDRVPNTKRTELIKSKAIRQRPDLAAAMKDQTGGNYITTTLRGLISGSKPKNYDGTTNMESNSIATFKHSRVVVGRMNAWTEKDFSYDITGGEDFLEDVARQVAEYWSEIDQDTLLHVLKGVFNMTGAKNLEFVNEHTHDVTKVMNDNGKLGRMDATTINTGMQKACGDNKAKFSLAIMHSVVSTNLENLKILTYLKYNDANGLEREIGLATLNGRLVLIDDGMPAEAMKECYVAASIADKDKGALKVTTDGTGEGEVSLTTVKKTLSTAKEGDYVWYLEAGTKYTTYVLGDGAIEYTDCGAKVPYEVDRDPKTNGGEDTLYSRQRKCFAPFGISFTQTNMATLSPTDEELELGENWELVSTHGSDKKYIEHKSIPIARVISRG